MLKIDVERFETIAIEVDFKLGRAGGKLGKHVAFKGGLLIRLRDNRLGIVRICACGRLGEQQRNAINLQLAGYCLPTRGRCPEVERVAAEVSTQVSKSQDVVVATREPERGYLARRVGESRTS